MKRRSRARSDVRARVPEHQAPFFFVSGRHGGWFISLTWNFGAAVTVAWSELRRLLASSSKGEIVVGRRLAPTELGMLEQYRDDIEHEVHARVICRDKLRWRSPRKR